MNAHVEMIERARIEIRVREKIIRENKARVEELRRIIAE